MKPSNLLSTVKLPGFMSFIAVAFINAMVDLGHKIIIQNTIFKIYDDQSQVALTAVVNGLILLPFIFLFTPAGFLSDRFSKPFIMKVSAFSAIIITLLITLAYYRGWFIFAFSMTLILAIQSAIYSPAKYGYIRELGGDDHLSPANGFIQATTIVAILTGIIVFTVLFEWLLIDQTFHDEASLIKHIAPAGWLLVILSVIEWRLACRLSESSSSTDTAEFSWKDYIKGHLLKTNVKQLKTNPVIWYSVLGLSFFWGISQTFLAVFPAFAKIVLSEDNTMIIQGLLACSGIGIVVGSLLAGTGKKGHIKTSLIPVGAIGMSIILFIIPALNTVSEFAAAIFGFGLFGGLFIIPLNALIQLHSPEQYLGTILAGNNWIQNIVMTACLIMTFIAAKAMLSSKLILLFLPIITTLLACFVWQRSKQAQRT
ncbi:MFS transporter [Methylophaga sulfidovorans]|uniref:Acyl-[acyl-carrier-protein]-phospholipid O-acyltransferase / long-chain-fatty-acid--[acyl-carrier-protein] ligase n=1 Tax=Methylophaga sulfidovorans TaxID=45496 RepID=A0A1I4AWP3_9GAMM|nr:MFS transporter [Methylophaga sulfidovorans]SFK60713.1 acyl-[acyl-carrier-protein]-phospholipid O-acyltransferase / long-chain-fatty-acid--[acyl-carrier-protein] ligase [Methylophaga sulfidovorans]